MSINFNPGPKILPLLGHDQWTDLSPPWAAAANTGSGGTVNFSRRLIVDTGTTAGSTSRRRTGNDSCWSVGQTNSVIDWTKRIVMHFIIRAVGTTNGITRISLGKTTGDAIGNLGRKGVGVRINNLAIVGQAHDGTSLDEVDLSTAASAAAQRLTIISDGSGNVEWLVDGVSKGTSTGGPNVTGTEAESLLQAEVENGADAAQQLLQIADAKIYVEQ